MDIMLRSLESFFIVAMALLAGSVIFLTSEIHHAKKEILKKLAELERGE